MSDSWIGLIGVIAGVAITSIADAIKSSSQFRREKRWSSIDEQRRRLESIYLAVEDLRSAYDRYFLPTFAGLSTGRRPAPFDSGAPVPWARLRMLVNLYRPSLRSALEDLESKAPMLGSAIAEATMEHTGQVQADALLVAKMERASNEFSRSIKGMIAAIVAESRQLDLEESRLVTAGRSGTDAA